jgi:hypothetical protein
MSDTRRRIIFLIISIVGMLTALAPCAAQARTVRSTPDVLGGSPSAGFCVVQTLPPSFVDQGEFATSSSAADVVQVSCEPTYAGDTVKLSSQQLFSRCRGGLIWSAPFPYAPVAGPSFDVKLDDDGNATAVLWAGPACAPGESLVSAHLEAPPFTTSTTSFTVLPPAPSKPGVTALPSSEVEDDVFSSVATIIEVEFPTVFAERRVSISAEQLFARCIVPPSLVWVGADGEVLASGTEAVETKLDNDGNAFVVVLGGGSCASGTSEIEVSLLEAPYTTYTTSFMVEPPGEEKHLAPAPEFTIEKLQEIAGSGSGFTKSPLTGSVGQTVDYEILVKNTGNVPLTFSSFTDPHCDAGTIGGGPGAAAVAPGASTTYTCDHVLTSEGTYINEAAVTGTPKGETPITHESNPVEVRVPPPVRPEFTIEKVQEVDGSGFTTMPLSGLIGQAVKYEIVVKNTGNVPLTFSNFTDPHCDAGTIGGGPGGTPVAPGSSTTYTCDHVLTSVGAYINEATVTGTPEGEPPIMHSSNPVEVKVPVEAEFTIEKVQELQETGGSGGTFTTLPLTGTLNQTVDYEIRVTNTGNVPLTFSDFTDPHCDTGTITGGPGATPVAPGASTIYACDHVLTSEGTYINEATVTGTPEGAPPITHTSNPVEVKVPESKPKATPEQKPTSSSGVGTVTPPPGKGGVLPIKCEAPTGLKDASGPKRKPFTVQTSSGGIKQITFYLDGRKLVTLKQSQAKHGKFSIKIKPGRLSYGAHRLVAKTVMINPVCSAPAHSSVFVRPFSERAAPKFTG